MKQILLISVAVFASQAIHALAVERPNIILVFADDISARELPLYESSVWSKPTGGNTTDKSLRANTPVLDQMAAEGCWVKTAWASVVCSPSRAMMMTGRYAHRHKWWNNKDKGQYINESGKQVRDDHGSVIRTEVDFDDIDITFDFRFSGGKSFNFVIDDKQEKSVHAGHICRVSIFPGSLIIGDDKTGSMNLEVRKQRMRSDLSEAETIALEALLASTQSAVKVDIKSNEWHQLRVRIKGDIMKAFLDGELATQLKSPGFAHPTKTQFGFTVNGSAIEYDNLKVLQPTGSTTQ